MKLKYLFIALFFSTFKNYSQNFYIDGSYGLNGVFEPSLIKPNHYNLGVGYNFNNKFGLRLSYSKDKFNYSDEINSGTKNTRITINGTVNLLELFELSNSRTNFQLIGQTGLGYSNFKSLNPIYSKADNIMNVELTLSPTLIITDNISLKTNISSILNISQHYLFNGEITYTGTPRSITGIYYNLSAGILYNFN